MTNWTSVVILIITLSVCSIDAKATPLGVSGDTNFARAHAGNDWVNGEANFLGAGGKGSEGIGVTGRATLGEAGGRVGSGLLSIGAKVGLSADTGVSLGRNSEFKVLGTGVSFGADKGFEFCFWGSCLSIG